MDGTRIINVLALTAFIVVSAGCSITKMATGAVADVLAESSGVYATDGDIELVGAAIPFGLKTIEGLLAKLPDHTGLLLAAARGFTQYAYVYVEQPADQLADVNVVAAYAERGRARKMYLRARDYGLRGLVISADRIRLDPDVAVADSTVADVPLLYWTAVSWGAAISLGKDDPGLVADLPVVQALINRALNLDETYDEGAIHTFLITYEMSRPGANIDDAVSRAKRHFERAVELSSGLQAAPYIALAVAVTVPKQNLEEYERLLRHALTIDVDEIPEQRLVNLVMQRRARWLLDRSDYYFLE